MYGLMMLIVGLLGLMIVRQTPMLASDPTQITVLDRPHKTEEAQAQAIADNLILAGHELQTSCVERNLTTVNDQRQGIQLIIRNDLTITSGNQGATSWPASGPVATGSTGCNGSTAFTSSNAGSSSILTPNMTGQQTLIPMMSAGGSPQGRIYMLRSGMYVVATWAPPPAASATYTRQVCALATAYLQTRLGGADWVGTYDAAAQGIRIWYGVANVGLSEQQQRTATGTVLPVPVALTGLTDGCPAYVEPLHN